MATGEDTEMAISVSILFVTDEQICDFDTQPAHADGLCIGINSFDRDRCCHLHDLWDGMHYLFTHGLTIETLPFTAIKHGDVTLACEDRTHALYAATTRALATQLQSLSDDELRHRYGEMCGQGHRIYPRRYWRSEQPNEEGYLEMRLYVNKFRDFALRAADKHQGLLFCRYEDW